MKDTRMVVHSVLAHCYCCWPGTSSNVAHLGHACTHCSIPCYLDAVVASQSFRVASMRVSFCAPLPQHPWRKIFDVHVANNLRTTKCIGRESHKRLPPWPFACQRCLWRVVSRPCPSQSSTLTGTAATWSWTAAGRQMWRIWSRVRRFWPLDCRPWRNSCGAWAGSGGSAEWDPMPGTGYQDCVIGPENRKFL